jgi:hypothetical protein
VRLALPDNLQAVEDSVRDFLADRLPIPELVSARRSFQEALHRQGWSVPRWPEPWGGGLSADAALIVDRTLARAGAPTLDPLTVDLAGPLIMTLTDDLCRRRWLPAMARGGIRICAHESLFAEPALAGVFHGGKFRSADSSALVMNADGAEALIAVAEDTMKAALVIAPLEPAAVSPGLPLDPDTVDLETLRFEVLTVAAVPGELHDRVTVLRQSAEGRSWTGRLRWLFSRLAAEDGADFAGLGIALSGLEVLEMRVLTSPPGSERAALRALLDVRAAELGRLLAETRIAGLGYYALAAPDRARQHNELPDLALAAQDAEAELIRYLLADVTGQRDRLARLLGHGGEG